MQKNTSKNIVDIVTIAMLVIAFGLAYYTGLVGKTSLGEPLLSSGLFSLIAIAGSAILFFVGGISELLGRIKNNTVTKSFTAFFVVQSLAVVGMAGCMVYLLAGIFTTDSALLRILYIVFAFVEVLGYVEALIYTNLCDRRAALLAAENAGEAPEEGESDESCDESTDQGEE